MIDLRARLSSVLWLGGSACAGKSSVARRLAERFGLRALHCDDLFADHSRRAGRERHRAFRRLADRSPEELFAAPVERQVAELGAFYEDEFELLLEDLLALGPGEPVLVEGAGLLPARVAAIAPGPGSGLWLLADPGFRRRRYRERGAEVARTLAGCADPERLYSAWMERDDGWGAVLDGETARLGLPRLAVDGRRNLEEIAAAAAVSFGLTE